MQFEALMGHLQIPVVRTTPKGWLHNYDAPTEEAQFGYDPTKVRWCVYERWADVDEEVLHEACHLLCGPESVENEGDLMVFQWAVIQLLDPEPFRRCRDAFATYTWDFATRCADVGNDDAMLLADPEWQEIYQALILKGWLDADGKPLLRGPHPDWDPADVHCRT